ncbi:MAG: TonB-dependent receptor [Hyphomonadaceae bacterium]|nr:TonB-dependent receptor [Hyphomonadaceae bacterium]
MRALLSWSSLPALCVGLAIAPAAMAQDAPQEEEIIVTATKRSADIQDVAGAITAVGAQQIDDMGVDDFRELATAVPSLTFVPTSNSTTKIVLRGISTGNNYDATSSATGLYLDDVPMGSAYGPGGTEINLVDLARVEVLRGPQGTLYGAGSLGGTVRFVTRAPELDVFGGSIDADASVTEGATGSGISAVLNVPLINNQMAARFVAYHREQDGYFSNPTLGDDEINRSHLNGGRASLLFEPNSNWNFTLSGLYQDTFINGGNFVETDLDGNPLAGEFGQPVNVIPTPVEIRSAIGSFVANGDLGWADLTWASSYGNFDRVQNVDTTPTATGRGALLAAIGLLGLTDADRIPETFYSEDTSYQTELRLASPDGGNFDWLVGLFYQDYELAGNRSINVNDGDVFLTTALNGDLAQTRTTTALFGDVTWRFAPRWSIAAGGRFAMIEAENFQELTGFAVGGGPITSSTTGEDEYFTPRVELSFKPTDDVLLYVLYSEGYRAGGPNLNYPAFAGDPPDTYAPDTVVNYEAGAKTEWFEGRLVLNAAAFIEEFEDLQVVGRIGPLSLPYFANVSAAETQGVELELGARPTDNLSLNLAVTYTDAQFTEASTAINVVDGDRIPQIPDWSVSGSIDYDIPISSDFGAFFHLDGRYVGSSPADTTAIAKANNLELDAYTVFNGRVGIETEQGFRASLFVQNIGDERGEANTIVLDGLTPARLRTTIITPRTVGIQLAQEF